MLCSMLISRHLRCKEKIKLCRLIICLFSNKKGSHNRISNMSISNKRNTRIRISSIKSIRTSTINNNKTMNLVNSNQMTNKMRSSNRRNNLSSSWKMKLGKMGRKMSQKKNMIIFKIKQIGISGIVSKFPITDSTTETMVTLETLIT